MAWALVALAYLALLVGGKVMAEEVRADTGAWAVRCDAAACKASLPSAGGEEALLIGRWAGQDGIAIGFTTPRTIADRDRPIDLRADTVALTVLQPGRDYAPLERVDAFWITDGRRAEAIVQAMLRSKTLRLSYLDVLGAPHDADFDLGALARVIDGFDLAQQKTGARRSGIAAPASLAAPPSLSRTDLVIRMGVPARLLQRHRAASDCEDPGSPLLKPVAPVIGSVSRTAMLYAIPCTASGGNVAYRLWLLETGEIGGMSPLYFAIFDETFGWRGSDLLFNVSFDGTASRLISQFKARSDGGCGYRGVWRWKDFAFAMEEFRASPDCSKSRTPAEFPRIFPAK